MIIRCFDEGLHVQLVLENDPICDTPYVRCGPDGSVVLDFGDENDLKDLRDALLETYPLDQYPSEREDGYMEE